jgi:type VI secretion system protein ImpE
MNARELFEAGRLDEAIEVLGGALRDNPGDIQRRTFLFELLCFSGEYDRAEKQLDLLARGSKEAELGTLLYRSALHAERTRREMFLTGPLPKGELPTRRVAGSLNGEAFQDLRDADPRIGARLELFAAGQYTWLPFEHIESISLNPPKRLRDLLWAPAVVRLAASAREMELGEMLLPVLTPGASRHPDPAVRLGHVTEWEELDGEREVPVGQKIMLADDREIPILDLRELVITSISDAAS